MSSPINHWDWVRLRKKLRKRTSKLRRDSRVQVRFDESDLTSETVKKALETGQVPDGLNDETSQLRWLAVIQDNVLTDLYRMATAGKRDVRREQDLQALRQALHDSSIDQAELAVDPSDLPLQKAEKREQERLLGEAIGRLPSPQPDIFRLRQRGLKLKEIAAELGLPLSVVVGQYYRGVDKLKEELGDTFKDPFGSDENP